MAMFEFGKDLRRLFVQARESEDLGWVELIGVDLLALDASGLRFGVRPPDNDMCTPDKTPTALLPAVIRR